MFSIPLYSSSSGISKAWLTQYDPGLVTLRKAITNRNWKVTRLTLSCSRISDDYSGYSEWTIQFDTEWHWFTKSRIKHLCEALISYDCCSTSLNISDNRLGDEGLIHLCNVLISVNCKLTNLTVTGTFYGKIGLKHLCDALISTNCKSVNNLNVSCNERREEGITLLFTLKISRRRNKRNEEIKYLCKALTDTYCKLRWLNLRRNRNITDVGKQCLFEAITGTDWEVREGLVLCHSMKSEA